MFQLGIAKWFVWGTILINTATSDSQIIWVFSYYKPDSVFEMNNLHMTTLHCQRNCQDALLFENCYSTTGAWTSLSLWSINMCIYHWHIDTMVLTCCLHDIKDNSCNHFSVIYDSTALCSYIIHIYTSLNRSHNIKGRSPTQQSPPLKQREHSNVCNQSWDWGIPDAIERYELQIE